MSFPALLPAQTVPLLTTEEFTSEWKVSRDFIIAVAEKMPGERSFREQMIHLAGAAVLNFLETAFDDVLAQLAKVTPEHLTKTFKVDWKGRPEVTGRQMMLGMFVHTAHHRAQCEVYLRVKGIVPPDDLL